MKKKRTFSLLSFLKMIFSPIERTRENIQSLGLFLIRKESICKLC